MPRLKASVSICVKMVYVHKESAEVVALLCCCLRYLKIRECRPYPSVPVLVCAPGFARENEKNFFSLRLPCLFDVRSTHTTITTTISLVSLGQETCAGD